MCNCHRCVMGLYRICTCLFWYGISFWHLFASLLQGSYHKAPPPFLFPPTFSFFRESSPSLLSQISVGSFCFSFFLIHYVGCPHFHSSPPHSFFPISIPRCIFVVYTRFISYYISMMDLNTSLSPPLFHCFFLEVHLGPPLSLFRLVVRHRLSFHSSFFHLNLSQGDLSRAYLLSSSLSLNPLPPPSEISEASFLS